MAHTYTRSISYKGLFSLPKINQKLFWALSSILVLSLSLFYISQINETTWASFQVSGYDQKVQKLTKQTKDLEASFFESNSLQNIEELVRGMGFEKVAGIHYIQAVGGVIVTK